jgi:hypothetical protein
MGLRIVGNIQTPTEIKPGLLDSELVVITTHAFEK